MKKERKARPMLKASIFANGYRQGEFAPKVGLSEQAISGIITGRRDVTREEMARISQVLCTPMHILFGNEVGS